MRHRLFNIGAATSLLLCLATVVLILRAQSTTDVIIATTSPGRAVMIWSAYGEVGIGTAEGWPVEQRVAWLSPRLVAYADPGSNLAWCCGVRYPPLHWPTCGWGKLEFYRGPVHTLLISEQQQKQNSSWFGPISGAVIAIPSMPLAYVSALVPFAWIARLSTKRVRTFDRRRRGLCLSCGYDLRASHVRCPECGAAISHSGRVANKF